MTLQVQVIYVPEGELLANTLFQVPSDGGLIGRHPDCLIALPDSKRYLSGRHARLSQEFGSWVVEDLSTNGVFLNQSKAPLGQGRKHLLRDGDIMACGDYRIMVSLFSPDNQGIHSASSEVNHSEDAVYNTPYVVEASASSSLSLDDPFTPFDDPKKPAQESQEAASSALLAPNQESLPGEVNLLQAHPGVARATSLSDQSETGDEQRLIDVFENDWELPSLFKGTGGGQERKVAVEAPMELAEKTGNEGTIAIDNTGTELVAVSELMPRPSNDSLEALQAENFYLRRQLKRKRLEEKKQVYQALFLALDRTLEEFSPAHLEKLFDDYNQAGRRWFRQRDNWLLYRRHYDRLVEGQTCRLSFLATFQAAMKRRRSVRS